VGVPSTKRTALIAGATGLVGRALLELLLDSDIYGAVLAIGRRSPQRQHAKLTSLIVDFDRLTDAAPTLAGEDLYCCLGTTIRKAGSRSAFRKVDVEYPVALARAARRGGARRLALVSSVGADPDARTSYLRAKGEVEARLRGLFETALIFRPSLLLGARDEWRAGERFAQIVFGALAPIMVGPIRRYRPVLAGAVARAMLTAMSQAPPGYHIFESDRIADLASDAEK
jgi:uncharacterized protein YbjT (DUF2867 family)